MVYVDLIGEYASIKPSRKSLSMSEKTLYISNSAYQQRTYIWFVDITTTYSRNEYVSRLSFRRSGFTGMWTKDFRMLRSITSYSIQLWQLFHNMMVQNVLRTLLTLVLIQLSRKSRENSYQQLWLLHLRWDGVFRLLTSSGIHFA